MDPCLLIPFYSFCYHLISLSSVCLFLLCLHFFLDTPIIFSFTFFLSLSLFLWVFCALTTRTSSKRGGRMIQMTNGRFEQSWIWMVGHSKRTETNEEEFDNIMLAEWAKMRARRDRWEEEYKLVVEEMRRTVAYLKWKVMWWHGQAQRQTQLDSVTSQGLDAYAAHQAKMLELLAESCIQKWLPALSGANIVVDWGVLEMTVDSKTDENDEDEEENDDDPFDSYELDD